MSRKNYRNFKKLTLGILTILIFMLCGKIVHGQTCLENGLPYYDLRCGIIEQGHTNTDGSDLVDYYECSNNLDDYFAKEVIYVVKNRPNYTHDIKLEFEDLNRRGLDIFIYRCQGTNASCYYYDDRSSNDPKYWTYTIKNAHPNDEYYVIIDAKNVTGGYKIKATCANQGYLCDNYMTIKCGESKSGNTSSGSDMYYDYTCFHHSLNDFYSREVVYRIDNRPNYPHDLEIEIEDLDRVGLDIFIVENCGKQNYKCYAYKERSSSSPQKEKIKLSNTDHNKEYYVIIDSKNSTGKYRLNIYCDQDNYYQCDNYKELKCGEKVTYDTKDGYDNFDNYSCFHSSLKGFYAKEAVYKLVNTPNSNYDLELTFYDYNDRGLDIFIYENCGKNDYKCFAYKERSSSDPKNGVYTLYNLDYKKEYYIVIDAKSVTGKFDLTAKCKADGYYCERAKDIDCGETKYGHTKDGYSDYDNYTCFANHLTGFYEKELIYKINKRPNYQHDIYIYFEDIYDKGLDIYVVEDCGKDNYKCYAYKERSSSSPKKDYLFLYDTDPNKEYYIIIDAKNVTSAFYLTVLCEDKTRCEDPCFSYVYRGEGHYDFYYPDYDYGYDYYQWRFRKMSSGQTETKSKGDIYGYQFPFGSGRYCVSLIDQSGKDLCFYYIYVEECSGDLPMAKAFTYQMSNCSGNSCTYSLNAESSMGENLYYHWYFKYYDNSYNWHFYTSRPDTSVTVPYVDDLYSVCLVVTNYCGMSSICIQGDCFKDAYPDYSIQSSSNNGVELSFTSWNPGCTYNDRKVYIDWGDGKMNEYSYSNSLKPSHTYSTPGLYYICVRYYYECSGNSYDDGCTICICKTIRLGCDDEYVYDCDNIFYEQGEYNDGKWMYSFSHNNPPSGYNFEYYQITDQSSGQHWETDQSYPLPPGKRYLICVVYRNTEGCYYYCCKEIEVYYPSNLRYNIPDACGGSGSMLEIPVEVDGFSEITGFQFKIKINDSDIAQLLDTAYNFNPDLPLTSSDVTIDTDQNLINVAWTSDQADQSQTLEDGSILFVFKVMLNGGSGDETTVEIFDALAFNNITNQQIDISIDNGTLCVESSFSISGGLFKEDGTPLENTTVNLQGLNSFISTKTDANGQYEFNGLIEGDYEIYPSKTQSYHDGVNVVDLAVIKSFNRSLNMTLSPYQQQSANAKVQLDGSQLTVADETAINRMVTFDIDEFDDYSSCWKFIPESFSFSDPEKAYLESPPSSIVIEALTESVSDQNFVSLKIADINGSVQVNNSRKKSEVNLSFETSSNGNTGDSVWVKLNAAAFVNIQNLQFTIDWDPAVMEFLDWATEFDGIQLSDASFSERYIDDGKLTFVHSIAPEAVSFGDTTLFSMLFVLTGEEGSISSIQLSGDPVEILITDDNFESQDVVAEAGTVTVGMSTATIEINQRPEVYQNRPNPFESLTYIPIYLNKSEQVGIMIYDYTGKNILQDKVQMSAGKNYYEINQKQLNGPGVYFYQVILKDFSYSKSMIMIE